MFWLMVVFVAVVALFAVPLRFGARVDSDACPRWSAELTWLGGLVAVSRRGGQSFFLAFGPLRREMRRSVNGGERQGEALAGWRRLDERERTALVAMLKGAWAATAFRAGGDFRYGFADPATTAWAHAAYCLAKAAGGLAALTAEPDFASAGWRGRAEATAAVRPLALVPPLIRFAVVVFQQRVIKKRRGGKRLWLVRT